MHWFGKQNHTVYLPCLYQHGMACAHRAVTFLSQRVFRVEPSPQDEFSVNIYEEVVRFHLLSEHELCEEEASSEHTFPLQLHSCSLQLQWGMLNLAVLSPWIAILLSHAGDSMACRSRAGLPAHRLRRRA